MRRLSNKVVTVVGGAGFIGSHLCDNLLNLGVEKLIIIDDFSLGKERNIEKLRSMNTVEVCKSDASDYGSMLELYNERCVDVAFNLAVVPLPASLIIPKDTIDTNILITSTLCELLRKEMFDTLIHVSSSEAYGTLAYKHKKMSEEHPTYPVTPYAASKLACDHIALSYHKTFSLDISIARPFNAYGPRQNEKSYAGVVPITINRILSGKRPIIHGDGLQTRDYTYVEDIARAMPKFYECTLAKGKVINLSSGKQTTIKRLIHMIMDVMDYTGDVTYIDARPGDVRRHCGDISLAKELLGYSPTTSFDEGLRKTIGWYKEEAA